MSSFFIVIWKKDCTIILRSTMKIKRLAKMNRNMFLFILLLTAVLNSNAIAMDKTLWKSNHLALRFTYNNKWQEVTPTQDSTIVSISWLSRKSKGLIATCYLQSRDSSFGLSSVETIHDRIDIVAQSVKKNSLKRCTEYKQISVEKRYIDNYPCIFLNQVVTVKGLDGDVSMKIFSIVTAWNKKEIMFSSGSTIPILYPQFKEATEDEMIRVLRTLQFDR